MWSILYKNTDNNQECDGYLYIGDYLHEIDQKEIINNKKYEYDELTSKNAYIYQNAVKNDIYMDKLLIYKNNNLLDIIKKVEIKEQSLHRYLGESLSITHPPGISTPSSTFAKVMESSNSGLYSP